MPITPTYPGIYIEELPSSAHTITAAATSITVFVGYTHPFKTKATNWGKAVRIFSFTDYEREFGGFYASVVLEDHVPKAVDKFFLNGGSDAYVIALQPSYHPTGGGASTAVVAPTLTVGGIVFTGREPIDAVPMQVTINNLKQTTSANDTADVIVTYGSRAETFRNVVVTAGDPNFLDTRINGLSSLVTVAPSGAAYPAAFTAIDQQPLAYAPAPPAGATTFSTSDFTPVFQQDSALDKVPIFNLIVLPGVADNPIWSAALAFCERKQAFLIMDPPRQDSADGAGGLPLIETDMKSAVIPKSPNGALYFPYLRTTHPVTGQPDEVAPSGFVAGIYARNDSNFAVAFGFGFPVAPYYAAQPVYDAGYYGAPGAGYGYGQPVDPYAGAGDPGYGYGQPDAYAGAPDAGYGQPPADADQPYGAAQPYDAQPYGAAQQPYDAAQPYGAQSAPGQTYVQNGQTCRQYQGQIYVGGVAQQGAGTACLQPDGTWRVVN